MACALALAAWVSLDLRLVALDHPSLPREGFVSSERIDLPKEMLQSFFKVGDEVHVRVLSSTGEPLDSS